MPYPNSNILNIVIPQTSASLQSGQAPFVETIISGSRLILQTDTTGTLIGSSDINVNNITASNISASGYISSSNLYVKTNITDVGSLTVLGTSTFSGLVSASAGLTASAIHDVGTLTVIGNSTLSNVFATNLTASNVSASNTLSASNVWFGNSMTYTETMSTGSLTVPDITFTSTANTGSDVMFRIDTTVSTGSSVALQINASSLISGSAYAISASNGIIAGTNFIASNITASNISASGVITSSGLYIMHPSIGVIASADATFDLLKTGVQTLNFANDGTAIVMGADSTGYTLIRNVLIAPNISSSTSIVSSNITASNISSSGAITASSLNITGNSRLQSTFVTNLTASNISASGQVIATGFTGSLLGTSSWANISLSSSVDKINDNNVYYVTFVNNTGSAALKADADVLSYNPLTNILKVGNTSGSVLISNDNGSNANYISLQSDTAGALLQVGNPTNNDTASLYVGKNTNGFRVLTGQSTAAFNGVFTELITSIANTTNATSYTDTNAALRVDGGARISKDTWISGSLNVAGDFTVFGSSSVVYISSSTVIINDNIIQLNAYFPYERYSGFEVFDSGSNQRSASLLWDGQTDNWITVDQVNSSSNIIIGPTASFGSSITPLTVNRLTKAYEGNAISDSALSDDGTTLSYTGTTISSSRIIATTGSITYITGALVTYVTGSFTTLTIATGSNPGAGAVPVHPTASGMPGQINVDNNFIYVYTNNIWKRVPLSNWSI